MKLNDDLFFFLIIDHQMDDHELKQRVLQKEKEWLTVMQER